jgi:hypothetical protein
MCLLLTPVNTMYPRVSLVRSWSKAGSVSMCATSSSTAEVLWQVAVAVEVEDRELVLEPLTQTKQLSGKVAKQETYKGNQLTGFHHHAARVWRVPVPLHGPVGRGRASDRHRVSQRGGPFASQVSNHVDILNSAVNLIRVVVVAVLAVDVRRARGKRDHAFGAFLAGR